MGFSLAFFVCYKLYRAIVRASGLKSYFGLCIELRMWGLPGLVGVDGILGLARAKESGLLMRGFNWGLRHMWLKLAVGV